MKLLAHFINVPEQSINVVKIIAEKKEAQRDNFS